MQSGSHSRAVFAREWAERATRAPKPRRFCADWGGSRAEGTSCLIFSKDTLFPNWHNFGDLSIYRKSPPPPGYLDFIENKREISFNRLVTGLLKGLAMAFHLLLRMIVATGTPSMKTFWIRFSRWLNQDVLGLLPRQESIMGKLIAFYVPANFTLRADRWTAPEQRGKVLAFTRHPRKITVPRTVNPSRSSAIR